MSPYKPLNPFRHASQGRGCAGRALAATSCPKVIRRAAAYDFVRGDVTDTSMVPAPGNGPSHSRSPSCPLISAGQKPVLLRSSFGEDHSDFVWASHILAGVSLGFQDTSEGEVGKERIVKINQVLKTHVRAHPSSLRGRGLV